ncbi:MAG: hypothetical protein KA354_24705 [Phycisphaerae bacterium]|nr:hypothetical protein [Phycisphaerae bacterium]
MSARSSGLMPLLGVRAFEHVEHEEMGEGTHQRLHALADELCAKWQVPIPAESGRHGCCGHR